LKTVIFSILFVAALVLTVYSFHVLLVAFAGILVSILIRAASDWLHAHSRLSEGAALAVVVSAIAILIGGNIWAFGVSFASHIEELSNGLSEAWQQLKGYASRYAWGQALLDGPGQSAASGAGSVVSTTVSFLGWMLVMIFVALYTAANPRLYVRLFKSLFRKRDQPRVESTLVDIGSTLRMWLLGQMISMIIVGVVTTIALLLMGVPMALTLGFLTAILNFIPNVGAIFSAGLAAGLALTQSAQLAGYVLILYVVIQCLEGYLLTPLIQQRTVDLPPGVTITVQALMGVLAGGIGLTLAAPLAVVGMVLVRKLYLKEDLHERAA
jgi:predicted PurR-regulated permease PerM